MFCFFCHHSHDGHRCCLGYNSLQYQSCIRWSSGRGTKAQAHGSGFGCDVLAGELKKVRAENCPGSRPFAKTLFLEKLPHDLRVCVPRAVMLQNETILGRTPTPSPRGTNREILGGMGQIKCQNFFGCFWHTNICFSDPPPPPFHWHPWPWGWQSHGHRFTALTHPFVSHYLSPVVTCATCDVAEDVALPRFFFWRAAVALLGVHLPQRDASFKTPNTLVACPVWQVPDQCGSHHVKIRGVSCKESCK